VHEELTVPFCSHALLAIPFQVLEKNGGDDGIRTRGLCRDRATTTCNLLDFNGTDSPFLILEGVL
jgi:hypothetical protein